MDKKKMIKGSYTIEASVYVPMMIFLILIVLRGGIKFYQDIKTLEVYEGLTTMDAVEEFYTYQVLEEIGEDGTDD